MILIFGGVYQGKLEYALERFRLTEDDVGHCTDRDGVYPKDKKIIYEFDKWILSLIYENKDVLGEVKCFIEDNKDSVVICNDISCGVVPTDPIMRKWREAFGKSLGMLAQKSDEVIRLYCGIPSKLK